MSEMAYSEPEKIQSIDAEFLAGHRFPYQEDISLVEGIDLLAATPGEGLNWLEDIPLLEEEGLPAVLHRHRGETGCGHRPSHVRIGELLRAPLRKRVELGPQLGRCRGVQTGRVSQPGIYSEPQYIHSHLRTYSCGFPAVGLSDR